MIETEIIEYRLGTNHPQVGNHSLPHTYSSLKEAMEACDLVRGGGYTGNVYLVYVTRVKMY